MISVIILGPVISTLSCLFFSYGLNTSVLKVTLLMYLMSSLSVVYLLYTLIINDSIYIMNISQWSTSLGINLELGVDIISVSTLLVVILVGTCVISYSMYYMAEDAHLYRFIGLLSGFVSFMMVLAISTNLVVLFIGWELIGLYSYLLIGFWSDRPEASTAALSAMLTNKLGDYLLSLGLVITLLQVGTLDVLTMNTVYQYVPDCTLINLLSITFMVATMAKSAQVGLHLWLIHAMQGPTPVSSLLHAATLVVAGPILLFKVGMIVSYNVSTIVIIGIISSLLGASLALIQQDIKGVIAYSTMSQFGYIVSIAALSAQSIAALHIATHGAFKACLFMAAGVVIHSTYDIQDNRRYGSLLRLLPIAYIGTFICTMSLIAIPYTAGAISKDLILEVHSSQYNVSHSIAFILGSLVATLTALYSIKLLIITFTSTTNMTQKVYETVHGANLYALIPISVLSILAIILGYMGMPLLIESYGLDEGIIIAELYNISTKYIPILMVVLGIFLALCWTYSNYSLGSMFYRSLAHRLYWPAMYTSMYSYILLLSSMASKYIDLGVLELVGPHRAQKLFNS